MWTTRTRPVATATPFRTCRRICARTRVPRTTSTERCSRRRRATAGRLPPRGRRSAVSTQAWRPPVSRRRSPLYSSAPWVVSWSSPARSRRGSSRVAADARQRPSRSPDLGPAGLACRAVVQPERRDYGCRREGYRALSTSKGAGDWLRRTWLRRRSARRPAQGARSLPDDEHLRGRTAAADRGTFWEGGRERLIGRRDDGARAAAHAAPPTAPARALRKRRSRRLLVTTKMLEDAIAAAAIIGLRNPAAATGMAATL
jgi:hypothetical protein